MLTFFKLANFRSVQFGSDKLFLQIIRPPALMCVRFYWTEKPISGTLTVIAMCKGQALPGISKDEFRITGNNSASEKRPTVSFIRSCGKSMASSCTKFSAPKAPVNNTIQAVFSSNSRIISRYCALFKFVAEARWPVSGLR